MGDVAEENFDFGTDSAAVDWDAAADSDAAVDSDIADIRAILSRWHAKI
jgi:hypothetical protein